MVPFERVFKGALCFCDNNPDLHNEEAEIPICSVADVVKKQNNIFLVGFLKNDVNKLNSVEKCLKENGVVSNKIIYIDMESGILDVLYYMEMKKEVQGRKI